MTRRQTASPFALQIMLARVTAASWETILNRTAMMATGTCSAAQYQHMVAEKTVAAQLSMAALIAGNGPAAVLSPYSRRARANARRLRKRK
jgi:hypothetical protein